MGFPLMRRLSSPGYACREFPAALSRCVHSSLCPLAATPALAPIHRHPRPLPAAARRRRLLIKGSKLPVTAAAPVVLR
ncbi:hypothetical protein Asp14428_63360 [Actinoplanes sp. NBRC 14428]|nr:hypothetical protein Asp14428_63360 [Actinoplanes sp. NBRC 14428]